MASLKRSYTKTTLLDLSAKIMDRLEETDLFQQASCIALYHAIPGEVQTAGLIEKWYRKKRLLLPLIKGNDLQLLLYAGKESLKTGVFGILEPSEDCEAVPESEIDLIIVPGVASTASITASDGEKDFMTDCFRHWMFLKSESAMTSS